MINDNDFIFFILKVNLSCGIGIVFDVCKDSDFPMIFQSLGDFNVIPLYFQQIQIMIFLDITFLNEDNYWVKFFDQVLNLKHFLFVQAYLAVRVM